jgi:hypothetical protein
MFATFKKQNGEPYSIDVWFNVYRVEEGCGKEMIGTFQKIAHR